MNPTELNALASEIMNDLCIVLQNRLSEVKEPRERLILFYLLSTEFSEFLKKENLKTFKGEIKNGKHH